MYYKDNNIEFRLGLGIKRLKNLTHTSVYITITKLLDNNIEEVGVPFILTDSNFTYPTDGNYKMKVEVNNLIPYNIHFTINDAMIKEFINQVKETVCNCGCKVDNPKRQKLFNISTILPYTIKPFNYGQASTVNPYLAKFFQLYFNETLEEKRLALGIEYFNYYITGTNEINVKLFNELVAINYYALYYYASTQLLVNAESLTVSYQTIINNFFEFTDIKQCLKCSSIESDIKGIMDSVFLDPCFCLDDSPAPSPIITITGNDVIVLVPYTIVEANEQVLFNYDVNFNNILSLVKPLGVTADFLVTTSIIDPSLLVSQVGVPLVNLNQFVTRLPNTSAPLTLYYLGSTLFDISEDAVFTCFVVGSNGLPSNSFNIVFKLIYAAPETVRPLVIRIEDGSGEKTTLDYKRDTITGHVDDLGEGHDITSIAWQILSYELIPGYNDPLSGTNLLLYTSTLVIRGGKLTPGYKYTIQLVVTNGAGQTSFETIIYNVLG